MGLFTKNGRAGTLDFTASATGMAQQAEMVALQSQKYLNRAHPPARVSATQAAELLGFHEDDIPVLVKEGILSPLGNPSHNAVKYFALVDVAALGGDTGRLSVATEAIYQRNKSKTNGGRGT